SPTLTIGTIFNGVTSEIVSQVNLGLGVGGAGDVTLGALSLSLTGLTVFANANANSTATLDGSVDLGAAGRTISVADGAAGTDRLLTTSLTGQTGAPVTFTNPGTTEYSGGVRNLYGGNTTVNEGTLVLNKTAGPNILGTLTVGDSLGGPDADVV